MEISLKSARVSLGDGLEMHFHEAGHGYPVIFLHGSGPGASGYSNFRQNIGVFIEAGYRVILPDAIGYGGSSKPADGAYHLAALASHLSAFLGRLHVHECALIGNSLGGAMALRLAIDQPDLVKAVVALAPGGLADPPAYMAMPGLSRMFQVGTALERVTAEDLRDLLRMQLFDGSLLDEAVVQDRLAIAKTQPIQVYTRLRVPNLTPELDLVRCPVLAFWGQDDKFCPIQSGAVLLERVPQAQLIQVNRCGHWVQVEHADMFNQAVLAFFRQVGVA